MRWMLVGSMFLFIDRPFEVWPMLGDWHIERLYMLLTMAVWCVSPKRFEFNAMHLAVTGFAAAVLLCWGMSPWAESTWPRVEDWFKILVFYALLVTTVRHEADVKFLVTGFVAVMGLYLLHSFREYLGGRHTFRMGIARMIGVDSSLGDPNSFAASIVVALPVAKSLWATASSRVRLLLTGYFALSILCVLLTGSRSGFLAMGLWLTGIVLMSRRRWLAIAAAVLCAPVAFFALPDSLQNRFETIINPDVGPANARESGEGRIEGLIRGFELMGRSPITGVGPGAWRPATKSSIESHSLIGQIVGEMGLVGVLAFAGLLAASAVNLRSFGGMPADDPLIAIARGLGVGLVLLLILGLFGHNLFRFTWLWYGGFLALAVMVSRDRVMSHDPDEVEAIIESHRVAMEPDNIIELTPTFVIR